MASPAEKTEKGLTEEQGSFGKVAIKLGFITQAQLDEAMKAQAAAAKAGLRKYLGEILIKKGYLTQEQLDRVLKGQTLARKKIGNYELLSKLGEGGMGAVFKARQVSLDRTVALKILSPKMAKNKEFRERFLREARAVAKLNHPHIVAGIDVGSADGYCYLAMEFVDGESLGAYMHRKGGKLEESEALSFIRQIALALHHAHENKLLHRDVKPDNVLLQKADRVAKLADLGLARSAEDAGEDASLTQAGQAVGTPFYISPEQARGRSDLTPATDLYSLGATMFHLLTGQVPFDGPTAAVIMTRHLTDPVPSLRSINSRISSGAEKIVFKLMEKHAEDRYADALELVDDIDRVLNDEGSAKSGGKAEKDKGTKVKVAKSTPAPVIAERERDEAPSQGSSSSITRVVRRRRRAQGAELGGLLVLIAILAAVLFLFNPLGSKPKNQPRNEPETKTVRTPPPPQNLPAEPAPPLAVPAVLEANAEGLRTYKADFETGKHEHFGVDPLIGKSSGHVKVLKDEAGNHVLKLGLIRPNSLIAKDSGAMVRLLLPADLPMSRTATLSFMIHFERYHDANPEVKIWWDHKVEGEPRAISNFVLKDPTFASSWGKVHVQLNKAPTKWPSREAPNAPQFIDIYVGKPDETLEVFIDDVELIIPPKGAAPAASAAPAPAASGETPVKPAPAQPRRRPAAAEQGEEQPVAPPPKKKKAVDTDGPFGGAL